MKTLFLILFPFFVALNALAQCDHAIEQSLYDSITAKAYPLIWKSADVVFVPVDPAEAYDIWYNVKVSMINNSATAWVKDTNNKIRIVSNRHIAEIRLYDQENGNFIIGNIGDDKINNKFLRRIETSIGIIYQYEYAEIKNKGFYVNAPYICHRYFKYNGYTFIELSKKELQQHLSELYAQNK